MGTIQIGSDARRDETFESVTLDNMTGYLRSDFDLASHWDDIRENIESRQPFYALKDWRRVFRIPLPGDNVIYLKIVDEKRHEDGSFFTWLFSTEASRYFSIYRLFRKNRISTPDLLFTLGEKKGPFWVKSILCTRELRDHVALPEYFRENGEDMSLVKEMVIHETARTAARLHALGFYFSMDGRNIFIRKPYLEGEDNISLIDLDHVSRYRLGLPERTRKRNLARFRSTIKNAAGMEETDYERFMSLYVHYFGKEKRG